MAHKSAVFNEPFEDITLAEQRRHRQMGFTRGYSVGEEAGWRDGYIFGIRKGAQLSAEIGYYQGFAHAWIAILEHEDPYKQRKLNALHSLLEMTRSFPRTNSLLEDDTIQKLARIRAKFKQVNALILGTGTSGATASFFSSSFGSGGGAPPPPPAAAGGGGGGGAAAGTSAGGHGGIYHRGASCTSQESGMGSASFRGVSPSSNNNLHQSASTCQHHHHHPHGYHYHHHHAPPPNVEMSF